MQTCMGSATLQVRPTLHWRLGPDEIKICQHHTLAKQSVFFFTNLLAQPFATATVFPVGVLVSDFKSWFSQPFRSISLTSQSSSVARCLNIEAQPCSSSSLGCRRQRKSIETYRNNRIEQQKNSWSLLCACSDLDCFKDCSCLRLP